MSRRPIWIVFLLFAVASIPIAVGQNGNRQHSPNPDSAWPDLTRSMDNMHAEMMSVALSGDDDTDFVKMMLPHHQAAIDMAKIEFVYGKDPQMRRLAQEIVADQESEIQLMNSWLKQSGATSHKTR